MPMTSPIIENRIIENSPEDYARLVPVQQPIHHQSYGEH